jgi:hypothetical protein
VRARSKQNEPARSAVKRHQPPSRHTRSCPIQAPGPAPFRPPRPARTPAHRSPGRAVPSRRALRRHFTGPLISGPITEPSRLEGRAPAAVRVTLTQRSRCSAPRPMQGVGREGRNCRDSEGLGTAVASAVTQKALQDHPMPAPQHQVRSWTPALEGDVTGPRQP